MLSLIVLALGTIVWTLAWQERSHERALVRQQSRDLIQLQAELVARELASLTSDLLVLVEQDTLQRFWADAAASRQSLEQEYIRYARVKEIYDQIRVLDADGNELVRVNYHAGEPRAVPVEKLQHKAARYYYMQAQTLDPGEVLITPFDLNIENGVIEDPLKPVIRLITPVRDSTGRVRGQLVLNYLGTRLLRKLLDVSGGTRGLSMMLNGDGEYLLAPQSGAAWGWMLGHHRSFAGDYPEAWQRLAQDHTQGQFALPDGLFTFQWLHPLIPSVAEKTQAREAISRSGANRSALLLVSHVPQSVAYASSDRLVRWMLLLLAISILFISALAWYLIAARWQRREQDRQIAESERRLRRLSSQLLAAQEDERRSISRELHDELGQQVTAISLDVRSAAKERDETRRDFLIAQATREVDELLHSLHRIATRVRPFVLDDLGLQDAIESHVTEYERRTGIRVLTELAIPVRRITSTIGDNVYRIIQESLANIAKHSQAGEAQVQLYAERDSLNVIVSDQGLGFCMETRDAARLGILGIQERAELLGGQFQIQTSPGAGTRIQVVIPLPGAVEAHAQ